MCIWLKNKKKRILKVAGVHLFQYITASSAVDAYTAVHLYVTCLAKIPLHFLGEF